MLVRAIMVFVPLGAAIVLQALLLLMFVANDTVPAALTFLPIAALIAGTCVHIWEQSRGANGVFRTGLRTFGRMLVWVITPILCVGIPVVVHALRTDGLINFSFRGGLTTIIIGMVGGMLWLILLIALEKRFGTLTAMRATMTSMRPLNLVLLPVVATFLLCIGTASQFGMRLVPMERAAEFPHEWLFGGIEAFMLVVMVFAWSWIARVWLRSSWFWVVTILFLHALVAGYRTHRWEFTPASGETSASLTSGPLITSSFDWPDVIPPVAGFTLFLLWRRRRLDPAPSTTQLAVTELP